jgi:hypothetical protein
MNTDTAADCTCGHHRSDHFWEHCVECDRYTTRCTCDELWGGLDPYDGCHECINCEGYAPPKPPPPPIADPDQISLFAVTEPTTIPEGGI